MIKKQSNQTKYDFVCLEQLVPQDHLLRKIDSIIDFEFIRAKVEHPFRVIKRQFGHVKVRYRGLMKNTQQLHTLFALSNLWMMRHRLQS